MVVLQYVLPYLVAAAVTCVLLVLAGILWVKDKDRDVRDRWLDQFKRRTDWPLLILALALIPLVALQLLATLDSTTESAIEVTFFAIWVIFLIELGVRLLLANERRTYLRDNWFDAVIVVLPFARPLRVARSARAARVLRVGRILPFLPRSIGAVLDIMRERGLKYVLLFAVIVVFASAAVELALERGRSSIDDYATAVWWSISTLLPVGYGDVVPATAEGKVVATLVMLFGIALFAWVTATISAYLVEFEHGEKAVTTNQIMHKLEALEDEIRELRSERSGHPNQAADVQATMGLIEKR